MLKNESDALPLQCTNESTRKLGIFGPNAARVVAGGVGSSYIKAPYWISVYDSVRDAFQETGTEVVFADGARVNRW
jgi:beta-glucosidase